MATGIACLSKQALERQYEYVGRKLMDNLGIREVVVRARNNIRNKI